MVDGGDLETSCSRELSNVGLQLSKSILRKCMSLCDNLHIAPKQIAEIWEAYSINKNILNLDESTFDGFRKVVLQDVERNALTTTTMTTTPNNSSGSALVSNMSSMRKRMRTSNEINDDDDDDVVMTTPIKSPSTIPQSVLRRKQTPLVKYNERKGAGTTIQTFNPNKIEAMKPNNSDDDKSNKALSNCVQISLTSSKDMDTNISKPYRYMFTPLEKRAQALDQRITDMEKLYFSEQEPKIENYENIGVPSQNQVTVIGRICHEIHGGSKLNHTSILLEAPRYQNGLRVQFRMDDSNSDESLKKGYSIFPGQIVKAEGINASGRTMICSKLSEGPSLLPLSKTKAHDLLKMNVPNEEGRNIQVMAVHGPFTTQDNLEYEPLHDFLFGAVKEYEPDVVILMGPFVDMRHPTLNHEQSGDKVQIETEDGSMMSVSYETLFAAKISEKLETLFSDNADMITQFVLVPSLNDAVCEPVFPQPPLSNKQQGIQLNLPGAEGIDFGSLGLEHIPSPSSHERIHLVPNPCILQINEFRVGITTQDILFHMSSQEVNKNLQENRMARICRHLLHQRSFYPLFPPHPEACLDYSQQDSWSIPNNAPDLLLLPSRLTPFCRELKQEQEKENKSDGTGTLVINPGQLSKGYSGGTYAVMTIQPKPRDELETVDGNVEIEHGLTKRVRVDIKKI